MLDTKLKKTHKLTTSIITLCILIPAFLLVALYPRISAIMGHKKAEYKKEYAHEENIWTVESNFINYAMESSFYVYGKLLQEVNPQEKVDFAILHEYGWVSDYFYLEKNCAYSAEYHAGNHSVGMEKGKLESEDNIGTVTLEFDEAGTLQQIQWDEEQFEINYDDGDAYYPDWRSKAMESVQQYLNNVRNYEQKIEIDIDANQLQPKNFKITIALKDDSSFVWQEHPIYWYTDPTNMMWNIGGEFLILAACVLVAIMAFVLPFFKKLETGYEKLFSIPFEIVAVLAIGLAGMVYGMFFAMSYTCDITDFPAMEYIGFHIIPAVQWIFLLVVNFLGWACCFFVEYIVISSLRQFLFRPVYYLKNRILCVRIIRWIKNKMIQLYQGLSKINFEGSIKKQVLKLVLVNCAIFYIPYFIVLLILEDYISYHSFSVITTLLIVGFVGVLIYGIVLYIGLCKYASKVQKQYRQVLGATRQIAEGNFDITMDEELGIFQTMGELLKCVKHGFQKAVVEEAKSQSMKTELITNVSHDLKTPLTAIITYVDLLKREGITEEERNSYIQTLEQKSQRLKVLIEDLFEVSKAQSGNVTMNYMEVDIVNLMKQVKAEIEDQVAQSNLTFKYHLPDEKIILLLDGQRTYRVFENLLNNALKYAMPYTRVYVDVLKTERDVKVIFRNVSAEELPYEANALTERFVRGDASRQSEGSGLGLAIAKSFVELQNGKFNIEVDGDLFKVTIIWSI